MPPTHIVPSTPMMEFVFRHVKQKHIKNEIRGRNRMKKKKPFHVQIIVIAVVLISEG